MTIRPFDLEAIRSSNGYHVAYGFIRGGAKRVTALRTIGFSSGAGAGLGVGVGLGAGVGAGAGAGLVQAVMKGSATSAKTKQVIIRSTGNFLRVIFFFLLIQYGFSPD